MIEFLILFDTRQISYFFLLLLFSYGPDDEALYIFQDADFALLSDGTEPDPIFTYANQFALKLWETDFKRITSMPSRNSAEPGEAQSNREQLFEEMRQNGFFAYENGGVRISTTGNRFEIMNGAVWDLRDEEGNWRGRAAMFKSFKHI